MQGNPGFRSEVLWATEAGYRVSVGDRLTLEAAGFLHRYSRLRTMEPEPEYRQDSLVVLPLRLGNLLDGRSRGVELATAWQPAARWRVQTAYSYLHAELVARPASLDLASAAWSGDSPRHQLAVRSYLELPGRVELDALVRRVGRLSSMDIPAYLTADLRLGWRPTPRLEASLAGQHLLDSPHLEYISSSSTTLPAEVKAGIYGMLTWSLAP
jgi:iron complex outermembrane receptor protein